MSPILSPIPRNSPRQSPVIGKSSRTTDEMRQHIGQLKTELEIEKAKNKQQHRDKVSDVRAMKQNFDKEKEEAIETISTKLNFDHYSDLQKQRENMNKEKDRELRQIQR